ncbi:MAG TPA: hypothetical protein VKG63_09640 [Steroidobacteraceae bacterium]|nr:hypothetical protein [Steroidobacteraceae bacterium]
MMRRGNRLLELRSLTGRTHQLRVHCARGLDAPILGDVTSAGRGMARRWSRDCRTRYICIRTPHLPHPAGAWLTVLADLPPHMGSTFATRGFEARPPRAPERRAR